MLMVCHPVLQDIEQLVYRQILHCKNLRVVLTLLWVISVACSGASIPSAVSAAIWTFSLATEFPVIYQNG